MNTIQNKKKMKCMTYDIVAVFILLVIGIVDSCTKDQAPGYRQKIQGYVG